MSAADAPFVPAFLERAIEAAIAGARAGEGGPFGAVIVRDGRVLAEACNQVISSNDPTAHAEIQAIRRACAALGQFQLSGCDVYASCEPCPMCLGALYWARPRAVYFAASRTDAAAAGFDDALVYDEIARPIDERRLSMFCMPIACAHAPFELWTGKPDRIRY